MTGAEFAILTLIVEQPRHGYEIEQVIEKRGMREWTEVGFSSIYYLLKKLAKNELITSRTEPADGRGPARKVYFPTKEGIDACDEATISALATMHRSYPPLLLGIANFDRVSQNDALKALKEHHNVLNTRLTHLQKRIETHQQIPNNITAMFDYSMTMVESEMRWIEKFMEQLKDEAGINFKSENKD